MNKIWQFADRKTGYLLLVPAVLASLFVHIYPTLDAVRISFFDIQLLHPEHPFIGLGNYWEVFQDPTFQLAFFNTVTWTVVSVILACTFGMLVAVLLNRPYPGRGLLRALFLVPWVTPPFVVAIIFRSVLSETFSPINGLLMSMGILDHPINFLGNMDTFLFVPIPLLTIIMINVWCTFSFVMVMFLAGLQTISPDLYEAAQIDGASKPKQFFRITLPSLLPIIETVVLLQGIWQFNNFNISYLVTHGGPLNMTELLSVQVYNEAFVYYRYGFAAAISVIMLLTILLPAVVYIYRSVKRES